MRLCQVVQHHGDISARPMIVIWVAEMIPMVEGIYKYML